MHRHTEVYVRDDAREQQGLDYCHIIVELVRRRVVVDEDELVGDLFVIDSHTLKMAKIEKHVGLRS
jgi:hypothetical protein